MNTLKGAVRLPVGESSIRPIGLYCNRFDGTTGQMFANSYFISTYDAPPSSPGPETGRTPPGHPSPLPCSTGPVVSRSRPAKGGPGDSLSKSYSYGSVVMPLNPTVHALLCRRLGPVRIANEGEAMSFRYLPGSASGRTETDILAWGESYYVSCPFCGDTRQRLSINHRYGSYDPVTDSDNLHLARCFNEDCTKDPGRYAELRERIFGFVNRDQRRRVVKVLRGRRTVTAEEPLREASLPGEVVPLKDLPAGHPALAYLIERGFDPAELSSVWEVGFCATASAAYRLAQDRLIIPVTRDGTLIGWQARYAGERDWKAERLPKYYTMPSMPKRLAL